MLTGVSDAVGARRSLRPALAAVALLAASVAPGCRPDHEESRPNIILVSLDTVRADRIGAYGYQRGTTPSIDDFAGRSLLFEKAFSQASTTGPSHMSVMTGVLPETHGVRNRVGDQNRGLSPELPTLATLLSEIGYRCVAFTDGGNVASGRGFAQGFAEYHNDGTDRRRLVRTRKELSRRRTQPLFIFFHTYTAHAPYTPPKRFRDLYVDPDYSGGIDPKWQKGKGRSDSYWFTVDHESAEDRRYLSDLYDGSIRRADEVFGKLLALVDELGPRDETVVILMSDHGEQFQEHGGYAHEDVFQEVLHVPLVLSIPGERGKRLRGRRVKEVVQLMDLMPTILELAGAPIPGHLHGRSLLSSRRTRSAGPVVFSQYPIGRLYAFRRGDWKLIERIEEGEDGETSSRWELYDLAADPGESENLLASGATEYREIFVELRSEFQRIREVARRQGEALEAGELVELDEETRRQLEALGYL